MGTISFVLTGDEAKAVEALRRMDEQQRRLLEAFQETGRHAKDAGDEFSSAFERGAQGALGFVTALTGIGSVTAAALAGARLLTDEWEGIIERQREAAQTKGTLAEGRAGMIAAGLPAGVSAADLDRIIRANAGQYGVPVSGIQAGVPNILQQGGRLDFAQLSEAVEMQARLAGAGLGGPAGQIVGQGLRLRSALGGGSLEEAMGFARLVGPQLGIAGAAEQESALAPLALVGRETGWGVQGATQFAAYLARQGMSGERAATSAARLIEGLEDKGGILPERAGRGGKFGLLKTTGAAEIGELQDWWKTASPEDRDKVMARLSARAPEAKAAVRGLLEGEPGAVSAFAAAGAAIPAPGPATAAAEERMFADIGAGEAEPLARVGRAGAATAEAAQAADPGAMIAQLVDAQDKILKARGMGRLGRWMQNLEFRETLRTGFTEPGEKEDEPLTAGVIEHRARTYLTTRFGPEGPAEFGLAPNKPVEVHLVKDSTSPANPYTPAPMNAGY